MPKIKFENGTTVNFEKMPSQKDIDEVAKTLKIQPSAIPKEPSYLQRVGSEYAKAGESIISGIKEGAKQMEQGQFLRGAKTAALRTVGGVAEATFAPITEAPMIKSTLEAVGEGIQKIPGATESMQKVNKLAEQHPELAKDIKNVIDIATLGVGGVAEKPVLGAIKKGGEKIVSAEEKILSKVAPKVEEKMAQRSTSKATELVSSTEETMTKAERQMAIDEGRTSVSKLGKTIYNPSVAELRAGELLSGKLKSNPVKNVPIIKNEISTLGSEAERYLTNNAKQISAQTQADMFKATRDKMAKYSTEAEMNAYDEQMKMFLKLIPGKGGFNTANFYKALKEYETNIANKLARGKEALLDPTGAASAKLQAAKDIRKTVRDTIGDLHSEFKPKMFDLASLYEALDNVIIKAEKTTGNILERTAKKYPRATKVLGGAAAGALGVKALTK